MTRQLLLSCTLLMMTSACGSDDTGGSNATNTGTGMTSTATMTGTGMTSTATMTGTFSNTTEQPASATWIEVVSELEFPRTNQERVERIFTIKNVSDPGKPLQISNISLPPAAFEVFKVSFANDPQRLDDPAGFSSTWKPSLAPGETLAVRVAFLPQREELVETRLIVETNDPVKPRVEVTLRGNVDAPCAKLVGVDQVGQADRVGEETHRIDFTTAMKKEDLVKAFTLKNCSDAFPLQVSSLQFLEEGTFKNQNFALKDAAPFTLAPQEERVLEVSHVPKEIGAYEGRLVVKTDAVSLPDFRLQLLGAGRACGNVTGRAAFDGLVLSEGGVVNKGDLVTLNAQFDDGTEMGTQTWSVKSRPQGSLSPLMPQAGGGQTIVIDAFGLYVFEVMAEDRLGQAACEVKELTLIAGMGEDIEVELIWDTPRDKDPNDMIGTDLDLHYLHAKALGVWNDVLWDVYWRQPNLDWGIKGDPSDDPKLVEDDEDGLGPEKLVHSNPELGVLYGVGVYYYDDNGFGSSYATVKIFFKGTLIYESAPQLLQEEDTFWHVGEIDWTTKRFVRIDRVGPGVEFKGISQ